MDGIAGIASEASFITDCSNNAPIKGNYNVGGIVGLVGGEGSQIVNTTNNNLINGKYYIGGIAGQAKVRAQIFSSTNNGKISSDGFTKINLVTGTHSYNMDYSVLGGIVGYSDASTISDCYNNNNVQGIFNNQGFAEGGIVGIAWNNSEIIKCQNGVNGIIDTTTGNTTTNYGSIGGIVGFLRYSDVSQCFNRGNVSVDSSSRDNTGGIVGIACSFTISNCYNLASVKAGRNCSGGIIGWCEKYVDDDKKNYVYNCYNASTDITGGPNSGNFGGNIQYLEGDKNASVTGYTNIGQQSNVNPTIISNYTQADMKKEPFVNFLNTNNSSGIWMISPTINQGYPYLKNNVPK